MNRIFILILLLLVPCDLFSQSSGSVEAIEASPDSSVITEEKTPEEIRQEAKDSSIIILDNAQTTADSLVNTAKDSVSTIIADANNKQAIADSLVNTAKDYVSTIIADANNKQAIADSLVNTAKDSSIIILDNAQTTADSLVNTAKDYVSTIIADANNKQAIADSLVNTAKDSSIMILTNANNKAKKITSKAKVRQEFLDKNSLLLLAVFALLTIIWLAIKLNQIWTWRQKVNNKSIELPEIFISDWNKLSEAISSLSMEVGVVEDKEKFESLAALAEKIRLRTVDFAKITKANIDSSTDRIIKNVEDSKNEYFEGIKGLTQQLEDSKQENKQLKKGYDNNVKKKFILELISIKEIIEYLKIMDQIKKIKKG